jgi:anaerobic selenocysteine-containing dehydrogenase
MKKHGVWHDPKAKPKFYGYKKEVKADAINKEGVILDQATGVYWSWKKSGVKSEAEAKEKGYTKTKNAYKGYIGQKIGDKVYAGFKPDKLNKSGYLELYSELLRMKELSPLPTYIQIPGHDKMKAGELIMTTYKVAVHIHSRSANCKWLTEMYHDNSALINTQTAKPLGIKTGDKIKVKSEIGEITTTANVTEGVVPGVIAISHHLGHWEYGRYASGNKAPLATDDDPGLKEKWWDTYGVHPNWIIPNRPDPISGQQSWMDTVVKVTKA